MFAEAINVAATVGYSKKLGCFDAKNVITIPNITQQLI